MSEQALFSEGRANDLGYGNLKDYLVEVTGLAFYREKDRELAEKVGKRLDALHLTSYSAYLTLLKAGTEGGTELDELVADLTIGETYFFRIEEQFQALRQVILPALIQRNAGRRQLRIWSAGCSIGAEAYSLAILLGREFAGQLVGWDVSIIGTDINRKFLSQAREGRFGDWALRSTDDETKNLCFQRDQKMWRIRDEFRRGISFQYHNLAKHPYSLLHNLGAFDLVLCRNVMIYFSREGITDCVGRFWKSLVEGGWLLVGHAEMNQESFRAFHTINFPGTVLFQRPGESGQSTAPAWSAPASLPDPPAWAPLSPVLAPWAPPAPTWVGPLHADSSSPVVREMSPAALPTSAEAPPAIRLIRELADRAQWPQAAERCRALIDEDRLNPLGHFYQALVLEQMGQLQEADGALNRAIYLDRDFVLAHYHRGLLLQKGDDSASVIRSFRNVVDLLGRLPPETPLPEGDGISAADLRELAEMQLQVLEHAMRRAP